MANKISKGRNLQEYLRFNLLIITVVDFITFAVIIGLLLAALITGNAIFYYILAGAFLLFTVFSVFAINRYYKDVYSTFFDNLYTVTKYNYDILAANKKGFVRYEKTDLEDFKLLNNSLDSIETFFNRSIMITDDPHFELLDLEYVDKENRPNLISFDSFFKNLNQLFISQELFRNGLVLFNYENEEPNTIKESTYEKLYELVAAEFHDEIFLAANDKIRNGLVLFVPQIDSMNSFEKRLYKVADMGSLNELNAGELRSTKLHITATVYPYSDIDKMVSDLRFARKQGKQVNVYVPSKPNKVNRGFYHTSLNLNNICKIFERLSVIRSAELSVQETVDNYYFILDDLARYLDFECAGVASLDNRSGRYVITHEFALKDKAIFRNDKYVSPKLVNAIFDSLDRDDSFVLSSRDTIDDNLGKYFDIYGIKSGFFFEVYFDDKVTDFIYFANKSRPMVFDNYARETLMIFSSILVTGITDNKRDNDLKRNIRRYQDLLKITGYSVYSVYSDNFDLISMSGEAKDILGVEDNVGKCYKRIYGLNEPCKDCPVLTGQKKISNILNKEYETSETFVSDKTSHVSLLLRPTVTREYGNITNRYDDSLLINSFYSFKENLDRSFISKFRGYILLISFDNYKELIEQKGEEKYYMRLRSFINHYKDIADLNDEIYMYDDHTLAIILNENGRVDIINKCEKFFDLVKKPFDENDSTEIPLSPSFIAFEFPLTYNSSEDLLKSINRFYKEDFKDYINKELITFPDSNYVRSASREMFICELIDNAVQSNTLEFKFLPTIKDFAKNIVGAEILIRLADTVRNLYLSPYEFIRIAKKHGRIGSITSYLVNRIGEIYTKHGMTVFRISGLNHLSLNVDATYFEDDNFLNQIKDLFNQYKFPKEFIGFEFNERDLAEDLTKLTPVLKQIRQLGVYLSCDQYYGNYLSIDQLKKLGFDEVKFGIRFIQDLSVDASRITEIKYLVEAARNNRIRICAVGIEDKISFGNVRDISIDFYMQGYYFYMPINLDEFLDKLRSNLISNRNF
ncbi:MAG: EAL domain-containing protein [Bacilli bacterium]|nr:EAL domain-containing protein [Bacilli bacterium]